jgi:hypothetical protein
LDKVELFAKAPGDSGYSKVATDNSPSSSGSFNYTASTDGSYRFYTVAADKAGNVEEAPAAADASTVLDTTGPTVAFSGVQATYTVDQTVKITCTASDPAGANGAAASGIASTTCADVNVPAYTTVGAHTLTADAADRAGNTATASAQYTVQVTPTGLCRLTRQFVQEGSKYQALPVRLRAAQDATLASLCQGLDAIVATLTPARKAAAVSAYKLGVAALARGGWITAAQADTLGRLAAAL